MTDTESPEISMWNERTRKGSVAKKAVTSQHSTYSNESMLATNGL